MSNDLGKQVGEIIWWGILLLVFACALIQLLK